MITILGYLALWLSLLFGLLQFLFTFKKNIKNIYLFHRFSVLGLFFSTFVSFFSLMYLHVVNDFSLLNVFQNSHSTKPLLYRISGVWGNHEGSMLLWLLVLTSVNYWIYKLYNNNNINFVSKTLQIQAFVITGFSLFILLTSNPFEIMKNVYSDGLGFNPILQDPALAIHPPLLYFGYVGLSAAFSFSIATMHQKNKNEIHWYKYMKPFVIAAWSFLTVGIAFGSVWAYYELGWGGWWFWDPVENAALMPWLLATALLHSLVSVERKKILQNWVLLLSILSFLLSVIGTFLVRSGILTSVHTFALDPERGIYILGFVLILGVYSLSLFALKSSNFYNKSYFIFLSKEGSIFVNNLIMSVVCISVFFGTIYPLFVEIFTQNRISVGEPYFNSTVIPIMTPAILIMGLVPLLSWSKRDNNKNFMHVITVSIITFIVTILFFLIYKKISFFGFIGIFLSFWIIINIIFFIFNKFKKFYSHNTYQIKFNTMIIAHFGVALMILGITGSTIWQEEKIMKMKLNSETYINNYKLEFREIKKIQGANFDALEGSFYIYKNNEFITTLNPQNRIYKVTKTVTSEVSIHTNLLRDLYLVLGEGDVNEGWTVRAYYNPLVIWIWIGVAIIFLGGLIALKRDMSIFKK